MNAAVHLHALVRSGRTTLASAFCTQPYKVMDVSEPGRDAGLRLMLMSASPGLLSGDRSQMTVDVGPGARVSLETQAYQRLFRMEEEAHQELSVRVGSGAMFRYLPHPLVPQAGARLRSASSFHLEPDSRLAYGEVLCCGRKGNGEAFAFTRLSTRLQIRVHHQLAVREGLLWEPGNGKPDGIGLLEGHSHQASLFLVGPVYRPEALEKSILERLEREPGIEFGCTALPVPGLLVRVLGHHAEPLYRCLQDLEQLYAETGAAPPSLSPDPLIKDAHAC
ncbi:MAG TPA: urease accessory protein UreD [Chitinophagaceae bacterium]|jgi:urease accessory protein|nr:urease accessory protein UreD [Chitinophagaceae bacterium]